MKQKKMKLTERLEELGICKTEKEAVAFIMAGEIYVNGKPAAALDKLISTFNNRLDSNLLEQAEARGYNLQKIVTIASLIEKETDGSDHGNELGDAAERTRADALLNLFFLRKHTTAKLSLLSLFGRPTLCALLTCFASLGVYHLLRLVLSDGGRMQALVLLLLTGVVAVAVYVVTMLIFKGITADEVRLLPMGNRLASLLIRKGWLHECN